MLRVTPCQQMVAARELKAWVALRGTHGCYSRDSHLLLWELKPPAVTRRHQPPPVRRSTVLPLADAPAVLLGSGSAVRKQILEAAGRVNAAGVNFTVRSADIDESALGDRSADASKLVQLLAEAKADAPWWPCWRPWGIGGEWAQSLGTCGG
eukprot:Skav203391  [mRNA]  locus=scaffold3093:34177:38308:- [translate_table: standard]